MVSTDFPENREINRESLENFARFRPRWAVLAPIAKMDSMACSGFPVRPENREFFLSEQGIPRSNNE
jgi:hypothetical protein